MRNRIFGVIIILSFMFPLFSFFPKGGSDIYEPEQKAVIFYHRGREELILSVRYEGAAEEFAWLVPLPEPPGIEEADFAVFELMSRLAPSKRPHYGMSRNAGTLGMEEDNVEVIERRTVGAFDITVLRSSDASILREWLEERGFEYDRDVEEVLREYIDKGWCFVAMRIAPSREGEEVEALLSHGTIDPLRFSFATPRPVYPLRISSLNPGSSEVLIYVLGDTVYGHPRMNLEFAEAWQGIQVGVMKGFSELARDMEREGGCAVCKLRAAFRPPEMEDLYFTPASEAELAESKVDVAGGGGGGEDSFPAWAIPVVVLILAGLVTAVVELVRTGESGSTRQLLIIFFVSGLVLAGIFLPLGLSGGASGRDEGGDDGGRWPWEEDILITKNGWEKGLHPDGTVEIVGLQGDLRYLLEDGETAYPPPYDVYSMMEDNRLDEDGRWKWRVDHLRADTWQTQYFVVYDHEGEEYKFDLGMKEVHDARLSPQGDRLWIAVNPGVPVNKTEVLEYSFPGLDLVRSIIHDYCMMTGGMVMSETGRPLLYGHFHRDIPEDGGYGFERHMGLLPMFEEGADFYGESLCIDDQDLELEENACLKMILNSYFSDAVDGSPYLILHGHDMESVDGITFVFDTLHGELYEVGEGFGVWER